jgi:cytochrome c
MTIAGGWLAGSQAFAAEAGHFGYGRTASPAEIAGWGIDVRGDHGAGLPPGNGSVYKGATISSAAGLR